MENLSVSELVQRLSSDEESVRKMAVFKLQSAIGDPSFADVFINQGGLPKLRFLALHSTGNTLAYCLTSLSRLLELDKGWDHVTDDLIKRVVELVVAQPLVNVNRGAMSVLAAIVGHPHNRSAQPALTGFQRLKPAVELQPQFLPMLVEKITSADHALCANSLHLINSLMRDASANDATFEWPKFLKQLQELGVIKSVYGLMQGSAVQDLAHPLLEFQSLTKVLLKKWREEKVDLEKPDHRRAMRGLHAASNPDSNRTTPGTTTSEPKGSKKHHPAKWRRLGFETESPAWEFNATGFLGLMDLTDFVYKNEDGFQKLLLEQSAEPAGQRCPIARASLAATSILYEHFEVNKSDDRESQRYAALESSSRSNFDRAFKPLLLHWSRLHTSGLNAFIRLWKATGAQIDDFAKIEELVRILVEQIVGQANRTKDIRKVEEEMAEFDCQRLRELQMELLELTYEDAWGHHLRQVRDELNHEALQFVKEQRIRCLLQGAWFPQAMNYGGDVGPVTSRTLNRTIPSSWRYVRLSHNRRYLHYADFDERLGTEPRLELLQEKIDLTLVSSVVSNVSASAPSTSSSNSNQTALAGHASTSTKIMIHGYLSREGSSDLPGDNGHKEVVLLQLHPQSHTLASEWLDGLLMLLSQQPITAGTNKLVNLIGGYGLKIRLLNVRFEDFSMEEPVLPSREGVDEDYYYDIGGMEAA
jgi:engulfment/cell motility protein 1